MAYEGWEVRVPGIMRVFAKRKKRGAEEDSSSSSSDEDADSSSSNSEEASEKRPAPAADDVSESDDAGSSASSDDEMSLAERVAARKVGKSRSAPVRGFVPTPKEAEPKRSKNRPAEMSSKRPVSRYREVVEGTKAKFRDPRFDSMSGTLNAGHYETAYKWMDEYKQEEIDQLKLKISLCKKDDVGQRMKDKFARQMSRLKNELETKQRMEKRNNLKRKLRKDEKQRVVETGKRPYFMKQRDVRKEELREKYDDLEKKGGLKKYMAKRRKKNASKDRKAIPWVGTAPTDE